MARRRKKTEPKEVEFDLTPMIDVTFQLLIFFIVAMKFKQIERRQPANLSLDSGPANTPADPSDKITIRVIWDSDSHSMKYQVCKNDMKTPFKGKDIDGGKLEDMIADRGTDGNPEYRRAFNLLVEHLNATFQDLSTAEKIEIALTNETAKSVRKVDMKDQPPWGFITLALDASTSFNEGVKADPPGGAVQKVKDNGLEIVTKNTSPEADHDRSK